MCHRNVIFVIVLGVWPQTINTQYSHNTSALTPTVLTKSTPKSTPRSNVTSNSSFTSSKLPPSTDFPLDEPNPSSTADVTPTSTSDKTPTSTSGVTPTSPSESSTKATSSPPSPSTTSIPSTSPTIIPSTPPTSKPSTPIPSTSSAPLTSTPSTPTSSTPSTPKPSTSMSTTSSTLKPTTSSTPIPSTSSTPIPSTSSTPIPSTLSTPIPSTLLAPIPSTPSTPIPSTPSTPAPTPKWTLDNDRTTLEWEATLTGTVIIEAEEGYKIAVKVLQCDIDGGNLEFVTIGPGDAGKGVQFSYKVSRQPSYLFNTNVLYVEFYGTEASTFRANFSRVGEALTTTTTEITTSTQFLPTPSVNDSAVISVFISGRKPTEYADKEVLDRFRDDVRKMATEYCFDQNFDLAEDITINNVNITRLMPCHSSWPGYETCAQITFGVPVYQKEDAITPWQGYQLNSNHLSVMWNRYHKKYINEDISTFDVPDSNSWVKWQIIVSCGTTVIFLVCLLVLKYFCMKSFRDSKSDDMDAIIPMSNENDEVSLQPHYIQQLPPLFENTYQDITPGLSLITTADVRDELVESDPPTIELTEEDLGESGA